MSEEYKIEKKSKTSNFFGGAFLLVCGIILLLHNLTYWDFNFLELHTLWPILLIIIGIQIMKIPLIIKKILATINGAFFALVIISLFFNITSFFTTISPLKFHFHKNISSNTEIESNISKSIDLNDTESAKLNLSVGTSSVVLSGGSTHLIDIYTDYGVLNLNRTSIDKFTELDIEVGPEFIANGDFEQYTTAILNNSIPWECDIECGASQIELDFTNVNLISSDINCGMSDITIQFGDIADRTDMNITSGMSSLMLVIPENVGCMIKRESFAAGFTMTPEASHHFEVINSDYISKDFDNAKKKIYINVEGAFSNNIIQVVSKEDSNVIKKYVPIEDKDSSAVE